MPDTDRVSWVTTVIAAVAAWVWAVNASRRRPTMRVAITKSGTVRSARIVNGTESSSIATTALTKVTVLDRIDDRVEVTAVWTPPTSLVMRDWRSPVLADA